MRCAAIIERPDLELVGVHASGPDKIGRDAADLCGLDRPHRCDGHRRRRRAGGPGRRLRGLHLTGRDAPARGACRDHPFSAGGHECRWDVVRLAGRAGSGRRLAARAAGAMPAPTGDTTLYINGIDPGFSGDTLVYTALSLTTRATAITVQEIFDYGSYDDAEFTGVSFGFGTTPDHTPILFSPGVLTSMWGAQVRSLAVDLGIELDEVRERHEKWVTPEPDRLHDDDASNPAQVAAVRFAVEGIRDGEAVITMEHVNRLTDAAAPDWPVSARRTIPACTVSSSSRQPRRRDQHARGTASGIDHNQGGVIATAARAVNVIEAVCRAPSGHPRRPRSAADRSRAGRAVVTDAMTAPRRPPTGSPGARRTHPRGRHRRDRPLHPRGGLRPAQRPAHHRPRRADLGRRPVPLRRSGRPADGRGGQGFR